MPLLRMYYRWKKGVCWISTSMSTGSTGVDHERKIFIGTGVCVVLEHQGYVDRVFGPPEIFC